MPIDPSIALQVKPFQLESPFAQAGQAMSLQNLMQQGDMNRLKMQQTQQDQAREQEFRAAIALAKTPEEQLAVASKYMGAEKLGTMIQSSQDKKSRDLHTKEMAMARLTQSAQQFEMNYQARLRTVTTQEERLALDRQKAAFTQQLQSEAQRLAGAEGQYNFGFMPSAPPQPTVTPGPLSALQPQAAPAQAAPPMQPPGSLGAMMQPPVGVAPAIAPPPAPFTPTTSRGTPFPRVTPEMQAGRNVDQMAILQAELANEQNPANRAAIESEIAKLSGSNPFRPAGANPLPPAAPTQAPTPAPSAAPAASAPRRPTLADAPAELPMRAKVAWLAAREAELAKATGAGKALNEGQGKAFLYGTRAAQSDKILKVLEDKISLPGLHAARMLGTAGNYLMSSEQQRVDQAQRDFVNAVLRQESGAVISDPEFANAQRQYFPTPGDDTKTIAQKRANRQTAIAGFSRMAGPGSAEIDKINNPAPATPGATGGWSIRPIP